MLLPFSLQFFVLISTKVLLEGPSEGAYRGIHDFRDYTTDKHRTVDDYPYGGVQAWS
jgi:tRNA G37 N-methylase TrmD